jgi:hypothetical protein
MLTLDELKDRVIAEGYDECLICDILEISTEELLDAFEDKLTDKRREFDDYDSCIFYSL